MKRRLIAFAILASILSPPTLAWEEDLHYGLSKWLAYKVGFSLADAEEIALGAQSRDDGSLYPAPASVFFHTCLKREIDYSQLVQKYHFPSFGKVPGAPQQRAVVPGLTDNAAAELVLDEIKNSIADEPRDVALTNLGVSLHPLEDSWSHQGIPDIPPKPCSADLSWGHPASRGGYLSHAADITYLHVDDTVTTARRTYELLDAFLKTHPSLRSHAGTRWIDLEPAVNSFAQAKSKEEKLKWFATQPDVPLNSYTRTDFLKHISIPDSGQSVLTRLTALFAKQPQDQFFRQMNELEKWDSVPVKAGVDHLLDLWIVQKNIDALTPFTVFTHVAKGLVNESRGTSEDASLAKIALGIWLVRDHGAVEQLNHGLPPKSAEWNAKDLEITMSELQRQPLIEAGKLGDAIHALDADAPYTIVPLSSVDRVPLAEATSETEDYVVAFQFFNAPHDVVLLYVQRDSGGRWDILNINWFTL